MSTNSTSNDVFSTTSNQKTFMQRVWKKTKTVLWILAGLWLLLAIRSMYHQPVLFVWKYKTFIVIAVLLLWLVGRLWFKSSSNQNPTFPWGKTLLSLLVVGFIVSWFTKPMQSAYHELYMSHLYESLDKEEITQLPLTKNERVHARLSIQSYAYSKTNNNLPVSTPHLIKDKFAYQHDNVWSMANLTVEKNMWQIDDDIKEVYLLPSHMANPILPDHRKPVTFNTGESMRFDKNAFVNAIKAMGLNYFTTEPDDVYYMHDDQGKMVQVVSLVTWTGWLFPIPKFGGVIVVPSGDISAGEVITRNLVGYGTYISPENCSKYEYLEGQNLFSEKITRLYAESFSYRQGIYAAKFTKKDAIEIPDIAEVSNEYPFVSDYDWSHTNVKTPNGLYHYVPLEPSDDINTSLSLSLFMRSDGKGKIYYYDHTKAKDGLSGVTSILGIAKKQYPTYSWDHFHIADVRTYFPDIAELKDPKNVSKNYFYITSIVALNKATKQVDAGTLSDLVAVNLRDNTAVKLDAAHPEKWNDQIRESYNFPLSESAKKQVQLSQKVDTIHERVVVIRDTVPASSMQKGMIDTLSKSKPVKQTLKK